MAVGGGYASAIAVYIHLLKILLHFLIFWSFSRFFSLITHLLRGRGGIGNTLSSFTSLTCQVWWWRSFNIHLRSCGFPSLLLGSFSMSSRTSSVSPPGLDLLLEASRHYFASWRPLLRRCLLHNQQLLYPKRGSVPLPRHSPHPSAHVPASSTRLRCPTPISPFHVAATFAPLVSATGKASAQHSRVGELYQACPLGAVARPLASPPELTRTQVDTLPEPTGDTGREPTAGDASADRATLTWAPLHPSDQTSGPNSPVEDCLPREDAAEQARPHLDGRPDQRDPRTRLFARVRQGGGCSGAHARCARYLRRWGAIEREEEALHELWKQGGDAEMANTRMAQRHHVSCDCAHDVLRSLAFAQSILEAHKDMHVARRLLTSRGHTVSLGQLLHYFYGIFVGTQEHRLLKVALRDKRSRLQEDQTNDGSDDFCAKCGGFGLLVMCDNCPEVYHPECLGLESVPEDDFWQCPNCIIKADASKQQAEARGSPEKSLKSLSVSELKGRIAAIGLSSTHCLEKQDLVDVLLKASPKPAASAPPCTARKRGIQDVGSFTAKRQQTAGGAAAAAPSGRKAAAERVGDSVKAHPVSSPNRVPAVVKPPRAAAPLPAAPRKTAAARATTAPVASRPAAVGGIAAATTFRTHSAQRYGVDTETRTPFWLDSAKGTSSAAAHQKARASVANGLPPGWVVEDQVSSLSGETYKECRGPMGETTRSALAAWRMFNAATAPSSPPSGVVHPTPSVAQRAAAPSTSCSANE
ncbi:hypothetical protein AB1Y20_019787 [Prymnesium parvum]|uniref:PHD-type domain-containing protein n=1 Tax=Prymnesium parvum TaxID=97485 RepID=A0AB34JRW9_PRYPA